MHTHVQKLIFVYPCCYTCGFNIYTLYSIIMAQCYIIKRPLTHTTYSIETTRCRHAIVAFTTGKQAGTYKRLMNECSTHMNECSKPKKRLYTEKTMLDTLIYSCHISQLDVILYDKHGHIEYFEAPATMNMEDFRFDIEMKFRYA